MKKAAYIGDMDELISIMAPTETTDATGGVSTTWAALVANLWAKVTPRIQSGENDENTQITAMNASEFVIWQRTDITANMRVVWDGKEGNIIVVEKMGKAHTRIEADFRDNDN